MTLKTLNVYLVDDDRIFSVIAKATLNKLYENIKFFHLTDGEEALNALKNCAPEDLPSILFLDINMPILDGWEFLSLLDGICKKPFPICMTSSSIDPQDKRLADENPNVIDFVEKPFTREKIKELLDPLL